MKKTPRTITVDFGPNSPLYVIWDNVAGMPSFGHEFNCLIAFTNFAAAKNYYDLCVPKRWRKKRMEIVKLDPMQCALTFGLAEESGYADYLHLVAMFDTKNDKMASAKIPLRKLLAEAA